jgi:hypothetical protein
MRLGIHTVFLLRENILFLEEWLDYHASIGFEVFFLYDNSTSSGKDDSSITCNKYGYPIEQITRGISETRLRDELDGILGRTSAEIVYVQWEPRDGDGDIRYGQEKSIVHCISNFRHKSDWTAFIDMDEFIYCAGDIKLALSDCERQGIRDVVLHQKKFDDRFNNLSIPVTQIVDCIEGIDTSQWACKHIIGNENVRVDSIDGWNVHGIPTQACGQAVADIRELRFNHYNVNAAQMQWMKSFYCTTNDFALNAKCHELAKVYTHRKPLLGSELI